MARPLRVQFDRALHHVTSRSNARETTSTKTAIARPSCHASADRAKHRTRANVDPVDGQREDECSYASSNQVNVRARLLEPCHCPDFKDCSNRCPRFLSRRSQSEKLYTVSSHHLVFFVLRNSLHHLLENFPRAGPLRLLMREVG